MQIKREDCKFYHENGWHRVLHLPTNRSVGCTDNTTTDDELFRELEYDLNALEDLGLLEQHNNVICIREENSRRPPQ